MGKHVPKYLETTFNTINHFLEIITIQNMNNTLKSTEQKDFKYYRKKTLPHVIAVMVMYLLTIVFFSPLIFDNKTLPQGDIKSWEAMRHEVKDYHDKTGDYSEWTNSMFSGMPTTTMTSGKPAFNIFVKIKDAALFRLGLPHQTAAVLFFYMIGFYIFMICMGSSVWLALIGAVGYAFASYNIIIIAAGHVTKAYGIAFMPPIIGGIMLAYRKQYVFGSIITMLFLGLEIASNHQQITYYLAIIVGLMIVSFFINALIKKEIKPFFIASSFLLGAAILAVIPSIGTLYPTYDYSKDSMRGGSELTITPDHHQSNNKPNEGGLEIDYAYAWSYGKMETATLLVPNCYGGGHEMLDKNSETARELRKAGYGSTYLPTYWGNQPFTEGPVYVGAIICFLFILSLFVIKGPNKWWAIAACIVSCILAWGNNFMLVNEWLFHNLPLYNKFRTPSMSLVIAGVAMPVVGLLAIKQLFEEGADKKQLKKQSFISYLISVGLCLLVMLLGTTTFAFTGAGDASFQQQLTSAGFAQNNVDDIMAILRDYRQSMLYQDAIRSIIFISLAFITLWIFLSEKIKRKEIVLGALILFVLIDGWGVSKRYMGEDRFERKHKNHTIQAKTATDEEILKDPSINYRVLNLASNTFNEAFTSYYHKSIGGYSPAKLRRYQDMIDFYIGNDMQKIHQSVYQTQGNLQMADANQFKILNMLNAKYIIVPVQNGTLPVVNPHAYGNAWFVDNCKMVANPDEEILALSTINVQDTAIVDQRWAEQLKGMETLQRDTNASIVNTLCNPNQLQYTTKCATPQVAVFSEVFYDKGGWQAYIDGKEVPHFRANYILRAMVVPAGEHQITFKYIPYASITGRKIAMVGSILVLIVLAGAIFVNQRKKKQMTEA